MHHAAQVHVEDIVPIVERVRVDLTGDPDAGIVEQIVEPPRFLHRLRHGTFERGGVAHIEFDRMHLGAAIAKALRQFLCPADLTIGDPDLRAAIRQLRTERGSDARRASGDESNLS